MFYKFRIESHTYVRAQVTHVSTRVFEYLHNYLWFVVFWYMIFESCSSMLACKKGVLEPLTSENTESRLDAASLS